MNRSNKVWCVFKSVMKDLNPKSRHNPEWTVVQEDLHCFESDESLLEYLRNNAIEGNPLTVMRGRMIMGRGDEPK